MRQGDVFIKFSHIKFKDTEQTYRTLAFITTKKDDEIVVIGKGVSTAEPSDTYDKHKGRTAALKAAFANSPFSGSEYKGFRTEFWEQYRLQPAIPRWTNKLVKHVS